MPQSWPELSDKTAEDAFHLGIHMGQAMRFWKQRKPWKRKDAAFYVRLLMAGSMSQSGETNGNTPPTAHGAPTS